MNRIEAGQTGSMTSEAGSATGIHFSPIINPYDHLVIGEEFDYRNQIIAKESASGSCNLNIGRLFDPRTWQEGTDGGEVTQEYADISPIRPGEITPFVAD